MGQTLHRPVTSKETVVAQNTTYYVACSSMQGWRVSMEDSHTVILDVPGHSSAAYFAVFDGHGGSAVSRYASRHLHQKIFAKIEEYSGDVRRAIEEGFLELDADMRYDETISEQMAGSTAVCVIVKDGVAYCGNVGDSRAVAYGDKLTVSLSYDHKPTYPAERARIMEAGCQVDFNRVNGNLAVSRALGDYIFKNNASKSARNQAVTAFPEVTVKRIAPTWKFLLLACDGIWDVLTSEEAGKFISGRMESDTRPEDIVEELFDLCLAPDTHMGGIGSDNMTAVLVVFLQNMDKDYSTKLSCLSPTHPIVSGVNASASTSFTDTASASTSGTESDSLTSSQSKVDLLAEDSGPQTSTLPEPSPEVMDLVAEPSPEETELLPEPSQAQIDLLAEGLEEVDLK